MNDVGLLQKPYQESEGKGGGADPPGDWYILKKK